MSTDSGPGVKTIPLLQVEQENIIKTNFGLKNIPPCFGDLQISNPYAVKCGEYKDPNELELVKREFTIGIRAVAAQTEKCVTCWLFDKCIKVTEFNRKGYGK